MKTDWKQISQELANLRREGEAIEKRQIAEVFMKAQNQSTPQKGSK